MQFKGGKLRTMVVEGAVDVAGDCPSGTMVSLDSASPLVSVQAADGCAVSGPPWVAPRVAPRDGAPSSLQYTATATWGGPLLQVQASAKPAVDRVVITAKAMLSPRATGSVSSAQFLVTVPVTLSGGAPFTDMKSKPPGSWKSARSQALWTLPTLTPGKLLVLQARLAFDPAAATAAQPPAGQLTPLRVQARVVCSGMTATERTEVALEVDGTPQPCPCAMTTTVRALYQPSAE